MDAKEKSIGLPLVILFVVVAAVAFAALGYWEGKKTTETTTDESVPMPPVPIDPAGSATDTLSATVDATAGWKTYTNDTYNYSVKYPTGWKVSQDDSLVNISTDVSTENGANGYYVSITQEKFGGTPAEYLEKLIADDANTVAEGGPSHNFPVAEDVTINRITGTKLSNVTSVARMDDWYLLGNNGFISIIRLERKPGDGPLFDTTSYLETANQILSTFQFTK